MNKFLVHGLRWLPTAAQDRINHLEPGEKLCMMADFFNESDPQAVALRTQKGERYLIGYVPQYLARDAWKILEGCGPDFINVNVERINKEAPRQQRLLCRMNACWPEGFRPCDGEEFRPIPTQVPARCDGAP
ncbi:MAG: HIRAN domain-containing protein [Limisphaerales bacterium]